MHNLQYIALHDKCKVIINDNYTCRTCKHLVSIISYFVLKPVLASSWFQPKRSTSGVAKNCAINASEPMFPQSISAACSNALAIAGASDPSDHL